MGAPAVCIIFFFFFYFLNNILLKWLRLISYFLLISGFEPQRILMLCNQGVLLGLCSMESWVPRSHALQGRLRFQQLLILLFQLRKNTALFWLTTKRLKWAFLYSKHYCGSKPVTTLKSTVPGSSQMLRICCSHSTENIDEWALSIHHFIYT